MSPAQLQAIESPQLDAEKKGVVDLATEAKSLVVKTEADYLRAGELLKTAATLAKTIVDKFKTSKQQAHSTHKSLCIWEAEELKPVLEARGALDRAMKQWEDEQARIKREEAEAAAKAALALEEDRRLVEAIEYEEEGDTETAEAILATPVVAPVIRSAPAVPKLEGVSKAENWKAELLDFDALFEAAIADKSLRAFFVVDVAALNRQAKTTKDRRQIPGVRIFNDPTRRVRG